MAKSKSWRKDRRSKIKPATKQCNKCDGRGCVYCVWTGYAVMSKKGRDKKKRIRKGLGVMNFR